MSSYGLGTELVQYHFHHILLAKVVPGPAQIQEEQSMVVTKKIAVTFNPLHFSWTFGILWDKEPVHWHWKSPQISQASWHHRDGWDPLMSFWTPRINVRQMASRTQPIKEGELSKAHISAKPEGQIHSLSVFVNKDFWGPCHPHSFMYCLWLPVCWKVRAE